jgi:hypothetical protein
MEQSPMERLGLFASDEGVKAVDASDEGKSPSSTAGKAGRSDKKRERAAQKEIRRAYYRKSLQWHPDRWAGLGMYALGVQGAFELINEAYNALTGAGAGTTEKEGGADADVPVQEPVYD